MFILNVANANSTFCVLEQKHKLTSVCRDDSTQQRFDSSEKWKKLKTKLSYCAITTI